MLSVETCAKEEIVACPKARVIGLIARYALIRLTRFFRNNIVRSSTYYALHWLYIRYPPIIVTTVLIYLLFSTGS